MRLVLTQPRRWHEAGTSNFDAITEAVERAGTCLGPSDIVLLPELVGSELSEHEYGRAVEAVARAFGAWVVGGSHHCRRGTEIVNRGVAVDPRGTTVTEYEKLNPYAMEMAAGVRAGTGASAFDVDGRTVLVVLCADFWYSDAFVAAQCVPDLVLVPAFSISQRPSPKVARALWQHMAVSRGYEFAAFVGVSDWAGSTYYEGLSSSGVAGLANPNPVAPAGLFEPLGNRSTATFVLDFQALEELRHDRQQRGFGPRVARPGCSTE